MVICKNWDETLEKEIMDVWKISVLISVQLCPLEEGVGSGAAGGLEKPPAPPLGKVWGTLPLKGRGVGRPPLRT